MKKLLIVVALLLIGVISYNALGSEWFDRVLGNEQSVSAE